jgi:hypothetical protein
LLNPWLRTLDILELLDENGADRSTDGSAMNGFRQFTPQRP